MKKQIKGTIIRLCCVALCLILMLPILASCDTSSVYKLGPYKIEKDEYAYLMGMYKKKLLVSIGLDEKYLNSPVNATSSTTYGQYIENKYREEFEQSIYSLLYAQALFDEYDLELSSSQKANIQATASAIIFEFGGGSNGKFNDIAKPFGFSDDTLYSVYEKQAKESAVIKHLLGDDYGKVTNEDKEDYYKENYLHFQVIVVNTLYRKMETSQGETVFLNLNEDERAAALKLEKEVTEFLCNNNSEYNYQLLPKYVGKDIKDITYEDIWNCDKINDDSVYPQGYYMLKPTPDQMLTVNTLSQAMLTKEGDVSPVSAKRYFEGNGEIKTGDGKEIVKPGDYFEYGTAYIKRLKIDDGAWTKQENEQFFKDSNFTVGAAQHALMGALERYSDTCGYTLMISSDLSARYSFISLPANEIDYYYLYSKAE